LETPEKYNDEHYCPECKKAIIEALAKIQKKTELRYVPSNDFNIDELIDMYDKQMSDIREKNIEAANKNMFPIGIRVFPGMYKQSTEEHSTDYEIERDEKLYHYSFFRKSKELISLTKMVRFDLINDKIISDEYKRIK
jgi:hypothetical protein